MEQKSTTAKQTKKSSTKPETKKPSQVIALVVAIIAGILLIGLYFLMGTEKDSNIGANTVEEEIIDANCIATECLAKIETANTVEEITEVIGVDPEIDESTGTAKWKLNNKESVAREKSGSSYILQATINKDSIASENVDFSIFADLKKELESGKSFTYDELVKRLGDVEGTLAGKTDTSKRYTWVDKNNQTLSATFSDKTEECSIVSLR